MATNLAGVRECDRVIRDELFAAGAEVVELPELQAGEVLARLQGRVGPVTLRRAWRYWIASGPVPLDVARAMYEHPIGRESVRVAGHCGCPPAADPWLEYRDADGNELLHERERPAFERLGLKLQPNQRWSADPAAEGEAFVTTYHIDAVGGLRLFVDSVKALAGAGARAA